MDASENEVMQCSPLAQPVGDPAQQTRVRRSSRVNGGSLLSVLSPLMLTVLVCCWGSDLPSQVFPSWFPVMPGSTSPVFQPLAGWPRPAGAWGPADPGQRPPPSNPFIRHSGVHGFVDTMGTVDPNDDREYFIACRSDGIHIIDATPKSGYYGGVTWSVSASQVLIPALNPVEFIEETGWSYLLAGDPTHPLRPVPTGFPAAPGSRWHNETWI